MLREQPQMQVLHLRIRMPTRIAEPDLTSNQFKPFPRSSAQRHVHPFPLSSVNLFSTPQIRRSPPPSTTITDEDMECLLPSPSISTGQGPPAAVGVLGSSALVLGSFLVRCCPDFDFGINLMTISRLRVCKSSACFGLRSPATTAS